MVLTQEYIDCKLQEANACYTNKVYKLMQYKSQGDRVRYKKTFKTLRLMFAYLKAISCFTLGDSRSVLTEEQATSILDNLQKVCNCNCE